MKMPLGLAIATCMVLVGCNQPRSDEAAGGGGGKAAPAPMTDVQQARSRLGEAYVHAARTHARTVSGDLDGAVGAIRDVRKELTQAKQTARLETQVRINEMDQVAIGVQRELERRSLTSYKSTEKFVAQMQGLLASVPPQPISGGGGGPAAGEAPEPSKDHPYQQVPPMP